MDHTPAGQGITLMSRALLTLVTLLTIVYCVPANAEVNSEVICRDNEVFLNATVREPGCHPKAHLHQKCNSSRQCIDENTFCGQNYLTNFTEPTECVCKDYTKEVGGGCVVRHRCNISHFNPDYLQGDCPNAFLYCAEHRCLCRPGYTYDRLKDDCVPEEVETEKAVLEKIATAEAAPENGFNVKESSISTSPSLPPLKSHYLDLVKVVFALMLCCLLSFIVTLLLIWFFYQLLWFCYNIFKYRRVEYV